MRGVDFSSAAERYRVAAQWLALFGDALAAGNAAGAVQLMHPDGYWRDLLTFSWDFKVCHGPEQIQRYLSASLSSNPPNNFRLENEPWPGAIGEHSQTLEFFFRFDTEIANGRGFVRLVIEPGSAAAVPKAFTVLTAMQELHGFPDAVGRRRPREESNTSSHTLENWLDRRMAAGDFSERDPDVVVIGAGMSGLIVAARLKQLNVRTLVVDKSERLGDVWRKRYRTLKLHNEICMNHFPYMPFPENWPVYIPKDKLADWFEFYAESMELNVWMQTTFMGGEYDDQTRTWSIRLQTADGGIRTMRPRHIIMAMGVSGIPNIPKIEGIEDFEGTVFHSSGDSDNLDVNGKSILVVGAGTSGHDIAQSMHLRGAHVTMLQRSSITVVSLEPSSVRPYELYRQNEGVRPLTDTDMMAASVPYPLLRRLHGPLSKQMEKDDAELLAGLKRIGFLLDNGEDDTGYFLKLLRYQAGYYLNVGTSDLLVEGKIKLKSGVEIDHVTARTVVFSDGSRMDADAIVLATGYRPLQDAVRAIFGDVVADRVGPIWGIGKDGELCAMYARTGQDGFYVVGGGFMGARVYSPYTAMLIKAELEGLLPARPQASRGLEGHTDREEHRELEPARH